jgi:hypothetical protein
MSVIAYFTTCACPSKSQSRAAVPRRHVHDQALDLVTGNPLQQSADELVNGFNDIAPVEETRLTGQVIMEESPKPPRFRLKREQLFPLVLFELLGLESDFRRVEWHAQAPQA